jgi:hypothetical protein
MIKYYGMSIPHEKSLIVVSEHTMHKNGLKYYMQWEWESSLRKCVMCFSLSSVLLLCI